MKNIHYYIVTLVVLLFMVAPAKAVSEAEFGKLHKTYILHTDGSQEMRVQKELTLFTHTAMNRLYGESFIVYNPEFQGLKIHESYTRQKDGNIVKTPENAFVEVLPSAAADAPAYNGLKEMVVVHTGLELGATIYLDYSVITRPGYLPELDVCEQIEELSPIREYVLSVSVPENKPLHYELLNGKAVPVVKTAGGVKTVTWALKNVQPRPSMLAVSLPAGNVQAIVASTYASKADALKVIKRQFESNDKEVSELAKRLTANTQSPEQKTKQLTAYVQGLGNCRLSLSQTGYRLRPVAEVIRSAYGTEAEKAALLAALQQASGIQAEVKAVFPKTEDKDAAGLAAVSRLFVADNAIAIFIVTLVANKNTGEEIIGYTIVDRFIFLCYSVFKYLLISAIPFKLSYLYPFPFQVGEKIPMALWIYLFVILFIGYVIYLNRRKPLLVFCTLFFILHLLPVLHVIPLPRYVVAADRYLYIPYIAFAIGLSILSYHLYERQRKWILYAGFLYCSYLCVYTAGYAPAWKNSDTLKEHFKEVLKKRETNLSINFKHEKQ